MILEIADGRGELFQWDTGRIIEFGEDAVSQAHFTSSEKVINIPYTVEVKNRKAAIPDELLQVHGKLIVYAWVSDTNGGYTKVQVNFPVFARPKPSDYVYTPTEHAGFDRLRTEIGDLSALTTAAKDNLVAAINEMAAEIPTVDSTLAESGQAADAAEVGARLSSLSEEIANLGGGDDVSVEPAEDDIPKVFFGGALQQTKDAAVVPFRYISKSQDISGYAEIKAQGNSSMSYPKKNQTVKLFRDADCTEKLKVDFKGWGAQNKHVYKANWIDLSHARNVVSARLWADVVKSRAGYENLPELLRTSPNQGAVDGFPVKVYADGVYQGRYTLNIPKDKWAFNMDDTLDNHCVLCGENYVSGCFRAAAIINGSDWTDEIHNTVPESIKTRWNEVISFVMNSTDEEFKANLYNYFDVESLLDYHLFGLVSCGLDAYGKNQIYMTYDGQKWLASMYDMDSTWGLWWNGSKFVATDYDRSEYQDFKDGNGNLLYIRLEQLFYEELQARWAELKNGALSITNIINRFERFTDIAPAELVKEDYARTTGGGAFTGIPSKDTNNIQQIRAYAVARHAWCDTYVAGLTPSEEVPCTGISLSSETLTFTEAGTQTLVATVTPDNCTDVVVWESSNASVATVDGGVVTAVANGNAIITAKCGEYSASCIVSVSGIDESDVNVIRPTTSLPDGYAELVFDGTQDISIPDYGINSSGSYGGTHFEYVLPSMYSIDSIIAPDMFTDLGNGGTNSEAARGVYPSYSYIIWSGNKYLVTSLSTEDVGTTVETIKAWLAKNNIVYYLKLA